MHQIWRMGLMRRLEGIRSRHGHLPMRVSQAVDIPPDPCSKGPQLPEGEVPPAAAGDGGSVGEVPLAAAGSGGSDDDFP